MYETKLTVIFYKGCDTNDTGFYGKLFLIDMIFSTPPLLLYLIPFY